VRRAWREAALSAVALVVILLVLVSFDSRVREQVELRLSSPSAVVQDAGHGLQSLTSVVMDALRDQSLDRAPLLIFVFCAGVLLLFMLRT
jgi:hypothetical protein